MFLQWAGLWRAIDPTMRASLPYVLPHKVRRLQGSYFIVEDIFAHCNGMCAALFTLSCS